MRVRSLPGRGVFCLIGAAAATDWLAGRMALDRRGFVLTDRDLPPEAMDLAPAVSEGSMAVPSVLAALGPRL